MWSAGRMWGTGRCCVAIELSGCNEECAGGCRGADETCGCSEESARYTVVQGEHSGSTWGTEECKHVGEHEKRRSCCKKPMGGQTGV